MPHSAPSAPLVTDPQAAARRSAVCHRIAAQSLVAWFSLSHSRHPRRGPTDGWPTAQAEVLRPDPPAALEYHRLLEHRLQLTDVAPPGVIQHDIKRAVGHSRHREPIPRVDLTTHVFHEQRDVLAALPQRRHSEQDPPDPVVEVLPECRTIDLRFEVPMRRRNDPDVDACRRGGADRAAFSALQENVQPGDAGDVADHDGELEVHLDQRLLHTLDVRGGALHQVSRWRR